VIADVPRKRTFVALILLGAAAGGVAGHVDQARGVRPAADRIFSDFPADSPPAAPGQPAAAPMVSTGGAAALSGEL